MWKRSVFGALLAVSGFCAAGAQEFVIHDGALRRVLVVDPYQVVELDEDAVSSENSADGSRFRCCNIF